MKKLLSFSLLALLLLTGCSQKEVNMDENASAKSEESLDKMNSDAATEAANAAQEAADAAANAAQAKADQIANMVLDVVYFDFDKYTINSSNKEVAKDNANKISAINSAVKIKLEGNCDEWGTDEYNYALGLKRAKSVKDSLVAEGVAADSISLVSFGESNQVCTDKNKNCWKQNRRVEYKVLP